MQGILPEKPRSRPGKSSLITLYAYGLRQKKEEIQTFFSDTIAIWKDYIDPAWLSNHWEYFCSTEDDNYEVVILWLCVAFTMWYKYISDFPRVEKSAEREDVFYEEGCN